MRQLKNELYDKLLTNITYYSCYIGYKGYLLERVKFVEKGVFCDCLTFRIIMLRFIGGV